MAREGARQPQAPHQELALDGNASEAKMGRSKVKFRVQKAAGRLLSRPI